MKKENIIKKIIGIILLFIFFQVGVGVYKENKIQFREENEKKEKEILKELEKNEKTNKTEKTLIEEKYLGFSVDAKLEIPKINLETYILKEYSEEGMKQCASKYWGPQPNEVGNYCIAGHNYNQENMFNQLIDLEISDEIYLTDNINGIKRYKIYDIYKVKPENVEPLKQETNGERIITLITCINYSRNRLIVQAVESSERKEE